MGASTSSMVFSCLSSAVPSLMMRSATCSSSRPSFTKCSLRISGRGLLLRLSYTSSAFSLLDGGNGTAENGCGRLGEPKLPFLHEARQLVFYKRGKIKSKMLLRLIGKYRPNLRSLKLRLKIKIDTCKELSAIYLRLCFN